MDAHIVDKIRELRTSIDGISREVNGISQETNTKLKIAKGWLGMIFFDLGLPTPYPTATDLENIAPTRDVNTSVSEVTLERTNECLEFIERKREDIEYIIDELNTFKKEFFKIYTEGLEIYFDYCWKNLKESKMLLGFVLSELRDSKK